jgi:hypothetical protein
MPYQIMTDQLIKGTSFQAGNIVNGPLGLATKYFFVRNKSSLYGGQYKMDGWVKQGDSFAVKASAVLDVSTLLKFSTAFYMEKYRLLVKADSAVGKSITVDAYSVEYFP